MTIAAAVVTTAAAAGAALVESITNAVYEVLLSPVVVNLKTLPGLKEWTAAVGGQSSGVVTGAGEGDETHKKTRVWSEGSKEDWFCAHIGWWPVRTATAVASLLAHSRVAT